VSREARRLSGRARGLSTAGLGAARHPGTLGGMTPAALALAPPPASLIAAGNAVLLGTHPSVDATLHRVRPGVYAPAQAWADLTPWSRYLLRVHALHLIRPGGVFSHESAAALMGLPLFGHPRHLHLFDARRDRSLSYGDVRVHTSADPRRTQTVAGIHLTSVADTVIDLGRVLPPAFGLAVADAAMRRFGVTEDRLRAVFEHRRDGRGRKRVSWLLDRASPVAESVGESLSRAVIEWCGFPSPVLQHEHRIEGRLYRSDFCWPHERVVGESDGWQKYDANDPAGSRDALREEKRREDALRRDGWRVARWDYAATLGVSGLRDALRLAGLSPVRTPDAAQLLAVARNPRSG